jgi:hypothetical protein
MKGAKSATIRWTHPSVLQFAKDDDPVECMEKRVRACVLQAMDEGWQGPPFNPLMLADKLGIPVEALSDIPDARTVPNNGGVKIQFNPTRPRERVRFSVAHEIAHTLFPDVAQSVRNRGGSPTSDDWQLEMLCNIGAAEIIMPIGSLPIQERMPAIKDLMAEVRRFDVSAEAFFIRAAKVTSEPIMMFCASVHRPEPRTYVIDYSVGSRGWQGVSGQGLELKTASVVAECTAVGHTAVREEKWPQLGPVLVECVGVPAYPGTLYPRVAGIIRKAEQQTNVEPKATLNYVNGNVLEPQGQGHCVICQLVNDRARRWGGGVAAQSAKKYPEAEHAFGVWIGQMPMPERLGQVHIFELGRGHILASLIAQHGFGHSQEPRLRYAALQNCLMRVALEAARHKASVHLPRLGASGGGDWKRIEQMLIESVVSEGRAVTVYDLPPRRAGREADLFG